MGEKKVWAPESGVRLREGQQLEVSNVQYHGRSRVMWKGRRGGGGGREGGGGA